MNKTVTINISGIVFHIEEEAYERLSAYLLKLRNRFSEEEGRDEIMADIEARIAEVFRQRTGPSKEVVVMQDVDDVMAMMGDPEEISENTQGEKKEESPGYKKSRRHKLYRDVDNRVIGGVCSGLGHYFDLDPVWIRIGFALFFFAFGSGILFYILLMIIIPKAETTAEKLEMRGEPVDVNNIRRTIHEEFDDFKRKFDDFGKEAKQYGDEWKEKAKSWKKQYRNRDYNNGFEYFFFRMFRVLMRLLGFFLLLFGVLFFIGLITSTFSIAEFTPSFLHDTVKNFFPDDFHFRLAVAAFLIVAGIPLLVMIYKGARMLLKKTFDDRYVYLSALMLWITGVALGVYTLVSAAGDFSDKTATRVIFPMHAVHSDTLLLKVNIDPDMMNSDYNAGWNRRFHIARRWNIVSFNGKTVKFGYPALDILPSADDSIHIMVRKSARGGSADEALARAKDIRYNIAQTDSLLSFDSWFLIGEGERWRNQDVRVELYLPKNKVIYLHPSMRDLLDVADNAQNVPMNEMGDRRWKMNDRGLLVCIDCAGLETGDKIKPVQDINKKDSLKK